MNVKITEVGSLFIKITKRKRKRNARNENTNWREFHVYKRVRVKLLQVNWHDFHFETKFLCRLCVRVGVLYVRTPTPNQIQNEFLFIPIALRAKIIIFKAIWNSVLLQQPKLIKNMKVRFILQTYFFFAENLFRALNWIFS